MFPSQNAGFIGFGLGFRNHALLLVEDGKGSVGEHVFGIGFGNANGQGDGIVKLVQVLVDAHQAVHSVGKKGISAKSAPYVLGFGTPKHIGTLFLTKYLFPFELASILLLVAAIGAVVLARRRRGLEPDEQVAYRIEAPRPAYTGTMAEAAGLRPAGGDEPLKPEVEPVGTTTGEATTQQGGW